MKQILAKVKETLTGKKPEKKANEYINAVVVGAKGEVGSVLFKMLRDQKFNTLGVDLDKASKNSYYSFPNPNMELFHGCDFLHICIPYITKDQFMGAVKQYIEEFIPMCVVIHSTVVPGTTKELIDWTQKVGFDKSSLIPQVKFAYSPCRGQHNELEADFKRYPKWIVSQDAARDSFESHLADMGFKVSGQSAGKKEEGFAWLELTKLLDTSQYGILIMYAQVANRLAKKYGMPYDFARNFMADTQELYQNRPDIRPGYVGGKCVRQNIDLLNRIFSHKLWREFMESNKIALKEFGNDEE